MRSSPARERRFEAVAADVYEPLQRYLLRRASASDAADVLSESLLTVWRRLDDVPTDDPLPWCYGVARRCLANQRRGNIRRARLTEKVTALRPEIDDGDPQRHVERLDPELGAAIHRLSSAEREIVRLWAWEQLEPREIAVALELSPNAVSVALSRARRKLTTQLGRGQVGHRQDRVRTGQEPDEGSAEPGEET